MKKKLAIALAALLVIGASVTSLAFKNKAQQKKFATYHFYWNGSAWVPDPQPSSFPACQNDGDPCRATATTNDATEQELLDALNEPTNTSDIITGTDTEPGNQITRTYEVDTEEGSTQVQFIIDERAN